MAFCPPCQVALPFCLRAELSKCLSDMGCAVAKKLKHRRVGEKNLNFFLGGRINTLLQALLGGLACCRWHECIFAG